jgi:hypothetical protein
MALLGVDHEGLKLKEVVGEQDLVKYILLELQAFFSSSVSLSSPCPTSSTTLSKSEATSYLKFFVEVGHVVDYGKLCMAVISNLFSSWLLKTMQL